MQPCSVTSQQAAICQEQEGNAVMQLEEEVLEVHMSDGSVQYLTEAEYKAATLEDQVYDHDSAADATTSPSEAGFYSLQSPGQPCFADQNSQSTQHRPDGEEFTGFQATDQHQHSQPGQQVQQYNNSCMHGRQAALRNRSTRTAQPNDSLQQSVEMCGYASMDAPEHLDSHMQQVMQPLGAVPVQMLDYADISHGVDTEHAGAQVQQDHVAAHGLPEVAIAIGMSKAVHSDVQC